MLKRFAPRLLLVLAVFAGLLCTNALFAQQLAFPGAEGAGMYTTGGRGTPSAPTTVFEVTNLNDDNSPGSLRYALQASSVTYPYKTIVFRVSGTIHLTAKLNIRGNTTIAGQTAPGDGICLADYPVVLSGDNIIVRYLRFRMGDKNQKKTDAYGNPVDGSGGDDAFGGLNVNNIIIDHCSASWSDDEALTIYRGDNVTVQWCFVTEPLNYSYHFETGDADYEHHGYGGIWGAKHGSFHHNLIAHCKNRNPRFAGISTYTPNTIGVENADLRNNVIYNWEINTVYGGEGGNYNVVNNYYKYGPNTNSGVKYRIANPSYTATIPYGKWYVDGNYVDGSPTNTANNWAGVVLQNTADDPSMAKANTPFNIGYSVTTQSATDAYESVLQNAGATLPRRDTLDQRIVNNVRNRTGSIIDVQGGYPHGTPYNQTVNAWPTLNTGPAPVDSDHDGMPDDWETAHGLNPNDPADRNGVDGSGYTNLEVYLNSIMATNPVVTVSGTVTPFSQTVGTPSAAQNYAVSGSNLTADITVTAPTGYELSKDGGATWSATPLTLAQTAGTVPSTTLLVRLNAPSLGVYNGSIAHTSTWGSASLPVSGTASNAPPAGTNAVVAQDGSGNYTTIQAAIDAAPSNSTAPYIIYIKSGRYKEKISIPSNKPFLQLIGEAAGSTIISWDDYSGKVVNGVTLGTSTSATVTISATDCFLMNLTLENTTGNTADGPQALALNVNADRCAFKNCRFNGGQDTVLANGDGKRQYFKNCYIDGNTDFIFGSSTAVFDSCTIYPRDRYDGSGGGYVTAANTPAGQAYGYVFRNCTITKNRGVTAYTLGRPWQNDAATPDASKKNNKVVFLNTAMSTSILPAGWSVWDAGTNTALITYAEYKSKKYNGTPVDVSGRVAWSKQLSDAEAAPYYNNTNLFGSWDPCTLSAALCGYQPTELAVSNMRAQRAATNTLLSWNLSWPVGGVTYEVYRSSNAVDYAKINEITSATDTVVAFSLTDALPPSGISYSYFVKAVKNGYLPNSSAVVTVNSNTPLDGEFRSAGSGMWNNSSASNATSIWEKYVASSSSWVPQALGTKPGSSTNVTIRSGHTVTLDALNTINSLTIENGGVLNSAGTASTATGLQTLRVGSGTQPVSAFVRNDGTLGSTTGTNDGIIIEATTTCGSLLFSGTGTTSIARFRPIGGNPNSLNVIIDQDMTFKYNNVCFTGFYNSSSNTNSENVIITINAGKTVSLANPSSQFHLGNATSTANQQGSVTYNINGTLDLSATNADYLVPSSTNPASMLVMNVNNGGLVKMGATFGMANSTAASTSYGTSRININDGGTVDASLTNNLTAGNSDASGFFVLSGSGQLKRKVSATPVAFPVGTSATAYVPVTLTNTGTADNFSVSLQNSFDIPPAAPGKTVNWQWDIKEEVPGGSNVTLKLGWLAADQASSFNPAAPVNIMHFNGSAWEYTAASVTGSGTTADPYFATASGFTAFSPFGVTNSNGTLPLTLVSFKGVNNGGFATLEWTTAHEENTASFGIERSLDNQRFVEAGRVSASGNSAFKTYRFTDAAPLNGTVYYRLKMVDIDGRYTTSAVVLLAGKHMFSLAAYPNPAQGIVVVKHPASFGNASLTLFAADGRRVKAVALAQGNTNTVVPLTDLPKGVYLLCYSGEQTLTMQLIKE